MNTGQTGRHVEQFEIALIAPGQEPIHDAGIGTACVSVANRGREELVIGKPGVSSGADDDGRNAALRDKGGFS